MNTIPKIFSLVGKFPDECAAVRRFEQAVIRREITD